MWVSAGCSCQHLHTGPLCTGCVNVPECLPAWCSRSCCLSSAHIQTPSDHFIKRRRLTSSNPTSVFSLEAPYQQHHLILLASFCAQPTETLRINRNPHRSPRPSRSRPSRLTPLLFLYLHCLNPVKSTFIPSNSRCPSFQALLPTPILPASLVALIIPSLIRRSVIIPRRQAESVVSSKSLQSFAAALGHQPGQINKSISQWPQQGSCDSLAQMTRLHSCFCKSHPRAHGPWTSSWWALRGRRHIPFHASHPPSITTQYQIPVRNLRHALTYTLRLQSNLSCSETRSSIFTQSPELSCFRVGMASNSRVVVQAGTAPRYPSDGDSPK